MLKDYLINKLCTSVMQLKPVRSCLRSDVLLEAINKCIVFWNAILIHGAVINPGQSRVAPQCFYITWHSS